MSKFLSLLLPTRNRACYLPAAVAHFLSTSREDIELIVVDGSDDHCEVLEYLKPWGNDHRLQIVDNTLQTNGFVSSMVQNWSAGLNLATGQWLSIIGDDDVIDPSVIPFLEKIELIAPQVGAVTWHHAKFDLDLEKPREIKLPMGSKVLLASGKDSVIKQASWPNSKSPPTSIASPYHGAVRLSVLNKIKASRAGDWFCFNTPDYDLGWTVAWMGTTFAVSERPFSIAGVCKRSNSYAVRSSAASRVAASTWNAEGGNFDGWEGSSDPFLFSLPFVILGFRNIFCQKNNIKVDFSFENFLEFIRMTIQTQENQNSFDEYKKSVIHYLLRNFNKDFGFSEIERLIRPDAHFGGLAGDLLVIPHSVFNGDILAFARIAFGLVRPVEYLFDNNK